MSPIFSSGVVFGVVEEKNFVVYSMGSEPASDAYIIKYIVCPIFLTCSGRYAEERMG